mgnify:FL=1
MKVPKWLRVLLPTVLIGVWFLLGGVGGPYFGRVEEVSELDLSAFLPKSSEAAEANEEAKKFSDEKTIPAVVVFESKGELTVQQLTSIDAVGEAVQGVEGVDDVAPAIIAEDNKAAFLVAPIGSEEDVKEVLADIRSEADEGQADGLTSYITGPAGFSADLTKAFAGIDGLLLFTALAVVFVILLVVYRSAILPIVVLLTSILALSASILVVWWLASKGYVTLNGQVQGILFILVIGAATDYSLLYVSRYREALYRLPSKFDATLDAWKGAFEPIIASGGTVIVGLLCLLLSDLSSNTALGPVGSIGILFAMLAALTFLPAVLYAFGRVSFWPIKPSADKKVAAAHKAKLERGFWHRVGGFVNRRYRPIWIVTTIVLLAAAAFSTQIKAEGVSQSDLILGYSEARDGQEALSRHLPDGSGSPALVITSVEKYEEVAAKAETVDGVDSVSAVADGVDAGILPLGKAMDEINQEIRQEVQKEYDAKIEELEASMAELEATAGPEVAALAREQALASIPSVDSIVEDANPFKDAWVKVVDEEVLLQVTLVDAPDSEVAKASVESLRVAVKSVDETAIVGGVTAVQLDTNTASIRDRTVIIPVVLAAITIILMVLLRAIIAPILLLLSTIISFGASLGVAAFLFNDILHFPGADASVILYAFVFLVALGIDYNIFLMTRVREETLKIGTSKGVIKGLVVTGGVITSAGIVLAATFAALSVIPILFLFQLAFIVSFGVLLDTFIVRSLLVPALIKDIGAFVWWPSKLRHKK